MNKTAQKRLVETLYQRLVVDVPMHRPMPGNRCFYDDLSRYEYVIREEERDHRRFCPDGLRPGISARQSVKLFAIQRILEYRTGQSRKPPVEMILGWQISVFYAWAIWKEYAPAIRALFPMAESREFLASVDYAKLASGDAA